MHAQRASCGRGRGHAIALPRRRDRCDQRDLEAILPPWRPEPPAPSRARVAPSAATRLTKGSRAEQGRRHVPHRAGAIIERPLQHRHVERAQPDGQDRAARGPELGPLTGQALGQVAPGRIGIVGSEEAKGLDPLRRRPPLPGLTDVESVRDDPTQAREHTGQPADDRTGRRHHERVQLRVRPGPLHQPHQVLRRRRDVERRTVRSHSGSRSAWFPSEHAAEPAGGETRAGQARILRARGETGTGRLGEDAGPAHRLRCRGPIEQGDRGIWALAELPRGAREHEGGRGRRSVPSTAVATSSSQDSAKVSVMSAHAGSSEDGRAIMGANGERHETRGPVLAGHDDAADPRTPREG